MHIPSLVKIHWCLLKLSFGNEKTDERTDVRRTDRHTDVQRETIIYRHYCVAGYKNVLRMEAKAFLLEQTSLEGVWFI